jgi:hypothetical protein
LGDSYRVLALAWLACKQMHDVPTSKSHGIRFWEKRRLYYNLALVLPALAGFHSGAVAVGRRGLVPPSFGVAVLVVFGFWAVLANICYMFAYALEFLFGRDAPESVWVSHGREISFFAGTIFAMALALLAGVDVPWLLATTR